MSDQRILTYNDTKSKDYTRGFANSVLVSIGPHQDVVIDFCEEILAPLLITKRDIRTDQVLEISRDPNELIVEREKKFSVTMNKETAINLARWIMDSCGEVGER